MGMVQVEVRQTADRTGCGQCSLYDRQREGCRSLLGPMSLTYHLPCYPPVMVGNFTVLRSLVSP